MIRLPVVPVLASLVPVSAAAGFGFALGSPLGAAIALGAVGALPPALIASALANLGIDPVVPMPAAMALGMTAVLARVGGTLVAILSLSSSPALAPVAGITLLACVAAGLAIDLAGWGRQARQETARV